MSPKAKRTTPKARKSAAVTAPGSEPATTPKEPTQTVKLVAQIKRLEFLVRLTGKAQETFAPTSAITVQNHLSVTLENLVKAVDEAKALPVTFRFGAPGKAALQVGDTVTLTEKHAPKYAGAITGSLTVKEIGGLMILVESGDAKLAWVPRGHLTK